MNAPLDRMTALPGASQSPPFVWLWTLLGDTALDRLRPSPAARTVRAALERVRARHPPCDFTEIGVEGVEVWAERWSAALIAELREADRRVSPELRPWVWLAAVRAALEERLSPDLGSVVGDAFDDLFAETALEVRAASLFLLSHHAVERYVQRFRPGLDYAEARGELLRAAAKLRAKGHVKGSRQLVSREDPALHFIVARNGRVVTVFRRFEP